MPAHGPGPDRRIRVEALAADNAELRRANAILKTASAFLAELDRPAR